MNIKHLNIRFKRKGGTFAIRVYNTILKHVDVYLIQLSLKDPWWKPHRRYNYYYEADKPYNTDFLWGWLFFYVGKMHFE